MTKRGVFTLAGAVLLVAAGWALAQPGRPFPGLVGPDGPNRYSVSAMGANSAVMVDTLNGRTWVLHPSADGVMSVWLPAARVDDLQEAAIWQRHQTQIKDQQEREKQKAAPAK